MLFLLAEIAAVGAIVVWTVFFGLDAAVSESLARAVERTGSPVEESAAIRAAAQKAALVWAGGILAMTLARLAATWRRTHNAAVHLALPAVTLLTGLGLILHWGYADHARGALFYAPGYAPGVLIGGVLAALVMLLPWDPAAWAVRGRYLLAAGSLLVLGLLAVAGGGPGGTRIQLFGFQPIEGVKVAFVAFLAAVLGHRAVDLRYQRLRRGPIQIPRPRLFLPAILFMALLFGGLFVVRDLGPTLILALVFLGFYFVATHSWTEVALVLVALVLMVAFLAENPSWAPDNVANRLAMWLDPWWNGQPGGDQLAASLWAFAAGGAWGQGLGRAEIRYLPAGHTDLILAHLAEVLGLAGLALYLGAFLVLVLQGLWIARSNRTPERMLLAFGLSALLFAQFLVIFGGAAGLLPLTGVVVPFLSFGKTSMIAFLVVVGLLVRLAVDGRPRVDRDELRQLRHGLGWAMAAVMLLGLFAFAVAVDRTWLRRDAMMTRGVLAMGFDEKVFLRYDPRLREIVRRIRRGEIHDRNGEVIAGTDEDGRRSHPLGDAMGTLLGPVGRGIALPSWSIEGLMDSRLRGLDPARRDRGVWIEIRSERRDRILFAVMDGEYREEDHERAQELQEPGSKLLFTRLRQYDHSPILPLAKKRGAAREAAIRELADDVASRTVRLSIDARLQEAAARVLERVVPSSSGRAGAVVVLDVDSGQVLARAQWPDYDPARPASWEKRLREGDRRFLSSYGPWRDKTGIGGLYQSGSIFKVFTALAWAREGLETRGRACAARGLTTFECHDVDAEGPYFGLPDWSRPIHDGHSRPDGILELTEALSVSCNVFFSQLGLLLGPGPFEDLAAAGLEVDNGRDLSPGAPGTRHLASTAFGQGAARLHPMEAGRMTAAIADGGIYRKCPPTMLAEATCEERRLIDDASRLEPILSGMRQVVESGTARRLREPGGVRVYGKTGTATDPGRRDEEPWGLRRGGSYPNHSWFVAIAESDALPSCRPTNPGRIALAAVVPRGGDGNGAAMRVVEGVLEAVRDLGYFRQAR